VSTTEAALQIIAKARSPEDIRVALAAVSAADAPVRAALLARYEQLAAAGPRLDPTTTVRSEILIAIRDNLLAADGDLLTAAATTYEQGYSGELAGPLRAAALAALGNLDPALSKVHAVRLLADHANTNPMSGEPALSAARVLAEQGEMLALYRHALHGAGGEVLGECLRSLTGLPASLALLLAEQVRETRDEAALLGLVDLVLGHPDPLVASTFLPSWLRGTTSDEMFGYVVMAAVASRRDDLRAMVADLATQEVRRDRRAILEEALEL